MADPKYEGLPGIAYDQPDVYETTDLPEADQESDFIEEETDPIEKLNISASQAFKIFKGRNLDTKGVDFSDRISKKIRTGYDAYSGEWELVEKGAKETPLQKYQRLQCEMKELAEEVTQLKDQKDEDQSCLVTKVQVDQALAQLQELRLEEVLGTNVIDDLNDPQGKNLKKLLTQLEQFKEKITSKDDPPSETTAENSIVYELKYRPKHEQLQQTARLSELEHRINKLENILGTTSDKLSRLATATQQNTLYDAAQELSAKASLLESAQLDHIEGRLTALQQKMNSIAEQKAVGSEDPEKDIKINELYEVVKNIDNFSEIVPETINRLVALESVHNQAVDFNKNLEQLKTVHGQVTNDVQHNKELLQAVQESLAINLDNVNKGITSLNSRLESLKSKSKS